MENYSKQFPNLAYLLDCYFHEDQFQVFDWSGREHNYEGIVRYFKIKENAEQISKTEKDLEEFLKISFQWDEEKLDEILRLSFDGIFFAPFFGITYREFLEGVLRILKEPLQISQSKFIPKFIG